MLGTQRRTQLTKSGLMILLLGFIGFTLFPFGVFVQESSVARFVLYRVFETELSHFAGHFIIFSFIGTAVLLLFPTLIRSPIFYLSLMLNLAFLQEFLQLATFKRRPINDGELKDLGIDLTAAVFIFLIFYLRAYRRREAF